MSSRAVAKLCVGVANLGTCTEEGTYQDPNLT